MYKLTASIPFLLARLGERMGRLFSQRLAAYDLTLSMYRVLAALSEQSDQNLSTLSAMTTIELSTMSRLIGTMTARGLVSRRRQPGNERTVQINLTQRGASIAQIIGQEAKHYEEVAVSTLETTEIERLRQTLKEIYYSLDMLESELKSNALNAQTATLRAGD